MTRRTIAAAQGLVWVGSGLWPVIHLRSFERVTGPKPETWLVKAMGLMLASVGTTFVVAAARRRVSDELALLGLLSAGSVAAVDVRYAAARRISPVYFLDALLEAGFFSGWLRSFFIRRR